MSVTAAAQPGPGGCGYDVMIVGGGLSGLSAAIRLKQRGGPGTTVCVLDQSSRRRAHDLSCTLIDPASLGELAPNWKGLAAPVGQPVAGDEFWYFYPGGALAVPGFFAPASVDNRGRYAVVARDLCAWLAAQAIAAGVDLFTALPGGEVLYDGDGSVRGVAAREIRRAGDAEADGALDGGDELHARCTLFEAEAPLARTVARRFALPREGVPQGFSIASTELWSVSPGSHPAGRLVHTRGWPHLRNSDTPGWVCPLADDLVAVVLVTPLTRSAGRGSTFDRFQQFKQHPRLRALLKGGKRLSYDARAVVSGGGGEPMAAVPGGGVIACAGSDLSGADCKADRDPIRLGILAADRAVDAGPGDWTGAARGDRRPSPESERDWRTVPTLTPVFAPSGVSVGMIATGVQGR